MSNYIKTIDEMLQNMQKPAPEALYRQLGQLRNEMPKWDQLGKASSSQWVGRVIAVVEATEMSGVELAKLRTQFELLLTHYHMSDKIAVVIAQLIDTVLAKLELRLPAESQGAFIPAGGVFDGYQAVSKAMAGATKSVILVDPYADDKLISDFVPLAPEKVAVHVLTDAGSVKPSLKPAGEHWIAQWKDKRPLEIRQAPARSLHDRLIVTDHATAYVVGQSFKDLAKRAHSSLVRMDPDSAALKIEAHVDIWKAATKLA